VAAVDHRLRSARTHLSERILTIMQTDLQEKRPSHDTAFLTQVMDSLTRISGFKGLRSRLAEEIHLSQTNCQRLGLILFDIDNFQAFNQTWGHIAGDCLLAALANQLRLAAGADDFVARHGGEEFALVIRRPTKAEGAAFAETLREAVAQSKYRLPELLLPEARYSLPEVPLPPSPANRTFQEGMAYLRGGKLAEAAEAAESFTKALEQDREHVPSIMELEYLKLRQALSAGPAEKNAPLGVTVSGGVAWYEEKDTPESLLERAAGYVALAKRRGRNQIQQEP
jgi:diguanylate cyclase (GGDEF)-like protein